LALSGGGFRAAAFSLGAISYLNRAWLNSEDDTLLKHVTFITSTSGGTLTNAYYSSSLFKPGFVFDTFYQNMKKFMDGEALLQEVFAILNDPKRWDETGDQTVIENGKTKIVKVQKSQNPINAFAKAYDELLFKDKLNPNGNLFDVFFYRAQNPHLKTVCFNATELNNGMSFRFQTNGDPKSIFTVGNYYLQFKDANIARKLKLSDLSATSSCFPSGFEPIIYPTDYIHPGLTDVNKMLQAISYKNNNPLKLNEIINEPFCMVDGGVVDNQGLYSMMMEDTYRAEHSPKKPFDLMMVCDVGSYFNTAFKTPEKSSGWLGKITISGLKKAMIWGVVIFVISLLLATLTTHLLRRIGLLLLLPSGIYTVAYFYLMIIAAREKTDLAKSSIGKAILRNINYFFKLPLNSLKQMVDARLNSTLLISSDLFLKQERRQYYNEFYNMPAYRDRSLSCLIYEFSAQHDEQRRQNLAAKDKAWWPAQSGPLSPSAAMQQIATNATGMATTLWFDAGKQTMRDEIIICGQFTMCYNLLKHIYRLEVLNVKWLTDVPLQNLKHRLIADWDKFNGQADFML